MPDRGELPLVSVVTPTLDPPMDKLERCLDSVEAQSYGNIEHVVADGGSAEPVLEALRRRRLVRVVSEPDGGQSDALNKGFFDLARGKYLVWLNADDLLRPGAVEAAVAALEADPEAGWAYGNLDVNDRGGERVIVPPHPASMEAVDFNNDCLIAPGSTFTRWALEKAGKLDDEFKLEMDFDLAIRLLKAGVRPVYLSRSQALYEIYTGTKNAEASKRDLVLERHRIYLKNGMLQQAGAALALSGRYELLDGIEEALQAKDDRRARELARTGLRFMPSVLERHRISFWLTSLAPGLMRRIKRMKGRIPG